MHDVVIVGVPLIAILAGILFSRADAKELRAEIKDLRNEMKDLRNEMNDRFNAIAAEMRYFHGVTGKLDGRIEAIEKRGK